MHLDPIQLRVLGALIEKEITTPENYPLSLNALVNACNQRSSREPVMELTEEEVRQALHGLEDLALTNPVRESRVPKYEHRIRTVLNLRRDETAVVCLLLLRGPQTPGELRSRADRLYTFDDLAAVQSTLERLAARPTTDESTPEKASPLVTVLPRQPGSREARYAHLLGAPPDLTAYPAERVERAETGASTAQRVIHLEAEVANLYAAIQTLTSRISHLEASLEAQAEASGAGGDSSVR
ncbi:YceH family protein [Tunturibacter empetritectus]|uniref:YceH family protein n=1 Tax=Tunturiibacter empetritectus TaxID=3069691 RepID=A0AAU7ZHB8_9BACT